MNLDEYLFRKKISKKDFAQEIGISRTHLHDILSGRRSAGKNLAKKIEDATDGKVTVMELLFPKKFDEQ